MNIAYKASFVLAIISLTTLLPGAIMENWLMGVAVVSGVVAVALDHIGWEIDVREFHKR